jgi:uncharacterized cupredoxin-like copper-binding protein
MTPVEPVPTFRAGLVPGWVTLLIAVTALAFATAAFAVSVIGGSSFAINGMMARGMMAGPWGASAPQPGAAGFVAGTGASPRLIRVTAGPGLAFYPATIFVVRGETVTFLVTTMGPTVHEFMVGPADEVAADAPGTSEIADIGMMATKSLTITFDGPGPYAFACHVAGHYEAGMRGTIAVLPA